MKTLVTPTKSSATHYRSLSKPFKQTITDLYILVKLQGRFGSTLILFFSVREIFEKIDQHRKNISDCLTCNLNDLITWPLDCYRAGPVKIPLENPAGKSGVHLPTYCFTAGCRSKGGFRISRFSYRIFSAGHWIATGQVLGKSLHKIPPKQSGD